MFLHFDFHVMFLLFDFHVMFLHLWLSLFSLFLLLFSSSSSSSFLGCPHFLMVLMIQNQMEGVGLTYIHFLYSLCYCGPFVIPKQVGFDHFTTVAYIFICIIASQMSHQLFHCHDCYPTVVCREAKVTDQPSAYKYLHCIHVEAQTRTISLYFHL